MKIYIVPIAILVITGCAKQINRPMRPRLIPATTDSVSNLEVTVTQEKFDSLGNYTYAYIPAPGARFSLYNSEYDLEKNTK